MASASMQLKVKWRGPGSLAFDSEVGAAGAPVKHAVPMDTKPPLGGDTAASPKQLVLAAICGCSGMDVASLFRKFKLTGVRRFEIFAEAEQTDPKVYPTVFSEVRLRYEIDDDGTGDPARVLEAVRLSQTQFCGVSAMIARSGCRITYNVRVNGRDVGGGEARF